jgi:YegS/Rv2252/BmrU family lipid kinase
LPPPFAPVSGDPVEAALAHLRVALGHDPAIFPVETFEQATSAVQHAISNGAERVIAAGGDGTVRAVAEGVAGTEARMGIVPVGTVNVLARELRIPLSDTRAAVGICLGESERRIDLGLMRAAGAAPRRFLLMASVGFDALAVANVNTDIKGVVGPPAYLLSGLAALANFAPVAMTLRLDGTKGWHGAAFMAVITSIASYGGDFKIAPEAAPDDGFLDVVVFGAPPGPAPLQLAAMIRQAGALALGRHRQDPDIHFFRARQVEVTSDPPAPAQIDGDALGTTPLTVEIIPRALRVCAPPPAGSGG